MASQPPESASPDITMSNTNTTTKPLILPLATVAPAIFVPLPEDLTTPLPPFPSRAARLRYILTTIDTHSASVRANLLALFAREQARLQQHAALHAALPSEPPDIRPGMSHQDLNSMIANMSAHHNPAVDYNIVNVPPPVFSSVNARTAREYASVEIMALAHRASTTLECYDLHVNNTKEVYEKALKKALEEEAE